MPRLSVEQANERFQGVVVPLVTVFDEEGALDLDSTRANFQWLVEQGARQGNTVFLAAGSGGDFTVMNTEERKAVIRVAAEVSDGVVPTIAGVQSTDIRQTIELCQFCEEVGIDLAQISNAYYYDCKPDDVIAWHEEVARNTDQAFAVYSHWYSGSKYDVPVEVMEGLLEIPNTIAVKWASPDVVNAHQGMLRFVPKAAVVDNGPMIVQGRILGAVGWVNSMPNFYPHGVWKVNDLMNQERYVEAQRLYDEVMGPFVALIDKIAGQTAGEGVFHRPAMAAAGLKSGYSRLPSRDTVVTPDIREGFRKLIERVEVATAAD